MMECEQGGTQTEMNRDIAKYRRMLNTIMVEYRFGGIHTLRNSGIVEYKHSGMQTWWNTGIVEYRNGEIQT